MITINFPDWFRTNSFEKTISHCRCIFANIFSCKNEDYWSCNSLWDVHLIFYVRCILRISYYELSILNTKILQYNIYAFRTIDNSMYPFFTGIYFHECKCIQSAKQIMLCCSFYWELTHDSGCNRRKLHVLCCFSLGWSTGVEYRSRI